MRHLAPLATESHTVVPRFDPTEILAGLQRFHDAYGQIPHVHSKRRQAEIQAQMRRVTAAVGPNVRPQVECAVALETYALVRRVQAEFAQLTAELDAALDVELTPEEVAGSIHLYRSDPQLQQCVTLERYLAEVRGAKRDEESGKTIVSLVERAILLPEAAKFEIEAVPPAENAPKPQQQLQAHAQLQLQQPPAQPPVQVGNRRSRRQANRKKA